MGLASGQAAFAVHKGEKNIIREDKVLAKTEVATVLRIVRLLPRYENQIFAGSVKQPEKRVRFHFRL